MLEAKINYKEMLSIFKKLLKEELKLEEKKRIHPYLKMPRNFFLICLLIRLLKFGLKKLKKNKKRIIKKNSGSLFIPIPTGIK